MNKEKQPLLSICIPTYNRSKFLKLTLDSYVNNRAFDDDVEIVISDNASTDDTRELVSSYMKKYSNIKYFCNEENLIDVNMSLALDRGTGQYLKLMNDNLVISEDGLEYMKRRVEENSLSQTSLLFTNGIILNREKRDCVECNDFDDLIESLSFVVTAILVFGCWKKDWDNVNDKTKYVELRLCQDDWVYQIMENKKKMHLYTGSYCHYLKLEKAQRSGYNWFKIHVENYYVILQPYVKKGLVSKKALSIDRRSYLKNLNVQLVMKYIYNIMPEWQFDMSGATKILWKYFNKEPLFYAMILTLPIWGSYKVLKFLLRRGTE